MNNQTTRRDFLLTSALAAPAIAALAAIMGRETICQNQIITWNERGGAV